MDPSSNLMWWAANRYRPKYTLQPSGHYLLWPRDPYAGSEVAENGMHGIPIVKKARLKDSAK